MKRTTRTLFMAAAAAALLSTAAQAEQIRPEDRATFSRLVSERNTLHLRLSKLDRHAAEKLKQDERPVSIHAAQTGAQDRLDLVELRLETMAARLGLDVPPVPTPGEASPDAPDRRTRRAFARGRGRAVDELRRQCRAMLRSTDFEPFLAKQG